MNRIYKNQNSPNWWLDFTDHLGTRRRITTAITAKPSNKRIANGLAGNIEALCSAKAARQPLSRNLEEWLETAPPSLLKRLASIGLIEPQRIANSQQLEKHVDDYEKALIAKGNTKAHAFKQCQRIRKIVKGCGFKN